MRTPARSTRRSVSGSQPLIGKENHSPSHRERTSPPSSKKARHRLSSAELARLEDVFGQDTHPSRQQKKDLATELGMDYKTITIWFQNKRQTLKRSQPPSDRPDRDSGRPRADSCLRTVSSPSHNATLDVSVDPAENKGVSDGLNTITAKAIVKIKPLLDSLNALTSKSRRHTMSASTETSGEATNTEGIDQHWPKTLSESGITLAESGSSDQAVEQEQTKTKLVRWKRVRTLEWACERQTKRRKLSREAYVRLGPEDAQDQGDHNDKRMDSALSLLSLASSAQVGPPEDVMRGASLLLGLKHSWHRK